MAMSNICREKFCSMGFEKHKEEKRKKTEGRQSGESKKKGNKGSEEKRMIRELQCGQIQRGKNICFFKQDIA